METETPDLHQPVVGFRCWRVVGGSLRGQFTDASWSHKPNRATDARCLPEAATVSGRPVLKREHASPDPACACGIHAYHTIDRARRAHGTNVLGAVAVWGRMVPYADGVRAEHGIPLALWDPYGRDHALVAAARLGIPCVHTPAQLEAEAAAWGGWLPAAMVPMIPAPASRPAPAPDPNPALRTAAGVIVAGIGAVALIRHLTRDITTYQFLVK